MSNTAFRIHSTGSIRADFSYTDATSATSVKPTRSSEAEFSRCHAGGMALVAATVASQLLKSVKIPVTFYGVSGDDASASSLRHLLAQTPLDLTCFRQRPGISPTSLFHPVQVTGREGEGSKPLHAVGTVAWDASLLGESFFQATFNVYAALSEPAAWPAAFPELVAKGRRRGAVNIVALELDPDVVKSPGAKRLHQEVFDALANIDLLVADRDVVCQMAGIADLSESIAALLGNGLSAIIIRHPSGSRDYLSLGGVFGQASGTVAKHEILTDLRQDRARHPGDTVGLNDNFLAGLLSDLMLQILADDFYPKGELHIERELLEICPLRLRHAMDFAVVVEGLAGLQFGGLQIETTRGERMSNVRKYFPEISPVGRPW